MPRRILYTFLSVLLTTYGLTGCTKSTKSLASKPVSQRLAAIDGATLDRLDLQNGNVAYIQTIDLRKVQLDQLMGEVDHTQTAKGTYYPSQNKNSSPFFKRLTVSDIRNQYQKRYGAGIFSIINASFFEDYKVSSRLSFPIKLNGKVISTGNSPYGPIPSPADSYYRNIQLKALTWSDGQVAITNYNPTTGYPLNQPTVKNALVSYIYKDHPAYTLAKDPANKYHVLGILKPNQLAIVTVNRTTLESAAHLLRQKGVRDDLMTIDGGISTYLWNSKAGDLILPQVAEKEKVAALPHYLGLRQKANLN
ncbi:MAG: hypothetical protein HC852_10490 [Acaryochloridaceae cyanobacterium RU_4_10]|nr:hypothetical protein [Acaryochloridaceae cyanobacterium RU_4_10]